MIDSRRMALIAALGFAQLPLQAPELQHLHRWLATRCGRGGAPLYGLAVDEHVLLQVPAGDHIVTVSRRGPFLNDAAVAVRAEARRRYYYRIETSVGSADVTLLPVAPSAGEALVAKTR